MCLFPFSSGFPVATLPVGYPQCVFAEQDLWGCIQAVCSWFLLLVGLFRGWCCWSFSVWLSWWPLVGLGAIFQEYMETDILWANIDQWKIRARNKFPPCTPWLNYSQIQYFKATFENNTWIWDYFLLFSVLPSLIPFPLFLASLGFHVTIISFQVFPWSYIL